MQKPITVAELLYACKVEVAKGNANKHIYLSSDDEGNGYHGMYFTFTDELHDIKECDWNDDIPDKEHAVILG